MLIRTRELDHPFARMDRLMSGLLGTTWTPAPRLARSADLRVDVVAYDDRYELMAEVPGLGVDDVVLTAEGDTLMIEGERRIPEEEGARALARERMDYSFKRRFRVPPDVDWERVEATVRNGVLTVRLPRAEQSLPRRIAVDAG